MRLWSQLRAGHPLSRHEISAGVMGKSVGRSVENRVHCGCQTTLFPYWGERGERDEREGERGERDERGGERERERERESEKNSMHSTSIGP